MRPLFLILLMIAMWLLPFFAGCRGIPNQEEHPLGGLGEYSTYDPALREKWYSRSLQEEDGDRHDTVSSTKEILPLGRESYSSPIGRPVGNPEPVADNSFAKSADYSIAMQQDPPIRLVQYIDARVDAIKDPPNRSQVVADNADKSEAVPNMPALATAVGNIGESVVTPLPATRNNDWKKITGEAVSALTDRIESQRALGHLTADDEIRLRLLCLTLGQQAYESSPFTSQPLEKFWEEQCFGLNEVMQGRLLSLNPDSEAVIRAANHFQNSLDYLSQECPLSVRKAIFVKEATPYGLYEEYKDVHRAGTLAHLYLELDHPVCRKVDQGEMISLCCRWQLLSSQRQEVTSWHEDVCESVSSTRLRDIVLNLDIEIPESLLPGNYFIELTLIDRNSSLPNRQSVTIPVAIR